jgi:hypothetical protein
MTSKKQTAANRKNALVSTGPKTVEGKVASSKNALRHGLRSMSLVVPGIETEEEWVTHQDAVHESLVPVGYLEEILTDRIAATLWRLGRVVRYERGVLENLQDPKDIDESASFLHESSPAIRDDAFIARSEAAAFELLSRLKDRASFPGEATMSVLYGVARVADVELEEVSLPGIPDDIFVEEIHELKWTAGKVRACVSAIVDHAVTVYDELAKRDADMALEKWQRDPEEVLKKAAQKAASEDFIAQGKLAQLEHKVTRIRRTRTLPGDKTLEKIQRYEAHLERSLVRNLHELQRLQEVRHGGMVPPPAVLDVNVSTEAG